MCFYLLYLITRIFYQTFWFYWGGYMIIFLSFYLPWLEEAHLDATNPAFPSYREYVGDYQPENQGLRDVNDKEIFHEFLEYDRYDEELGAFQHVEDYFLVADPYFADMNEN